MRSLCAHQHLFAAFAWLQPCRILVSSALYLAVTKDDYRMGAFCCSGRSLSLSRLLSLILLLQCLKD
jgi:hypothetical protein